MTTDASSAARTLQTAAHQMRDADTTWMRAVADWLSDEAVLAKHAEYAADKLTEAAQHGFKPVYAPSTNHALEVARAWLALSLSDVSARSRNA